MQLFGLEISYIPSFGGFVVAALVVLFLAWIAVNKNNGFSVLFGQMYEGMEDFF